jgi:hypothetical protein
MLIRFILPAFGVLAETISKCTISIPSEESPGSSWQITVDAGVGSEKVFFQTWLESLTKLSTILSLINLKNQNDESISNICYFLNEWVDDNINCVVVSLKLGLVDIDPGIGELGETISAIVVCGMQLARSLFTIESFQNKLDKFEIVKLLFKLCLRDSRWIDESLKVLRSFFLLGLQVLT